MPGLTAGRRYGAIQVTAAVAGSVNIQAAGGGRLAWRGSLLNPGGWTAVGSAPTTIDALEVGNYNVQFIPSDGNYSAMTAQTTVSDGGTTQQNFNPMLRTGGFTAAVSLTRLSSLNVSAGTTQLTDTFISGVNQGYPPEFDGLNWWLTNSAGAQVAGDYNRSQASSYNLSVSQLVPGSYTLTVTAKGFGSASKAVSIASGTTTAIAVTLSSVTYPAIINYTGYWSDSGWTGRAQAFNLNVLSVPAGMEFVVMACQLSVKAGFSSYSGSQGVGGDFVYASAPVSTYVPERSRHGGDDYTPAHYEMQSATVLTLAQLGAEGNNNIYAYRATGWSTGTPLSPYSAPLIVAKPGSSITFNLQYNNIGANITMSVLGWWRAAT